MTVNYIWNYSAFSEREGRLVRERGAGKGEPFALKVCRFPCEQLKVGYERHLDYKIQSLRDLHIPEGAETLQRWRLSTLEKLAKKRGEPLVELRRKVSRYVEGLFTAKGERSLLFGCMHARQLRQTQTSCLWPLITAGEEDHRHSPSVAIDLRASPSEDVEAAFFGEGGEPCLDPVEGPDLCRRDLIAPEHLADLAFVQDVQAIYVERIPECEAGLVEEAEYNNRPFFEASYRMLAQGGTLSFDCDFDSKIYFKGSIFDIPLSNEVYQSLSFWEAAALTGRVKQECEAKGLPESWPADEREEYVQKRVYEAYLAHYLQAMQESLAPFAEPTCTQALLSPRELYFQRGELEESRFSFEAWRRGGANAAVEACRGSHLEGKIIIVLESSKTYREALSIFQQMNTFHSLAVVGPAGFAAIHPHNLQILNEFFQFIVEEMLFPSLQRVGFTPAGLALGAYCVHNKRAYSRIVTVQKK